MPASCRCALFHRLHYAILSHRVFFSADTREFDDKLVAVSANPRWTTVPSSSSLRRSESMKTLMTEMEGVGAVYPPRLRYNNCRISPSLQAFLHRSNALPLGVGYQKRTWPSSQCECGGVETFKTTLKRRDGKRHQHLFSETLKLRQSIQTSLHEDQMVMKKHREFERKEKRKARKIIRSRPATMHFCAKIVHDLNRERSFKTIKAPS